MINVRTIPNGNPFEKELEDETPPPCSQVNFQRYSPFLRISLALGCTVIVFILLIAGTATTAISYPPKPPRWKPSFPEEDYPQQYKEDLQTALDGDYKLIGPLLLTAGCFLLIVAVVIWTFVTRDAYYATRSIRPNSGEIAANPGTMSVLGGPFYLAAANPPISAVNAMMPFSRQLWAIPNAPTPDFAVEGGSLKGSRVRAATATLNRCQQPPYNPDAEVCKTGA